MLVLLVIVLMLLLLSGFDAPLWPKPEQPKKRTPPRHPSPRGTRQRRASPLYSRRQPGLRLNAAQRGPTLAVRWWWE